MILTLFVLAILPETIALYLLEADKVVQPESLIAAYIAFMLVLFGPISRLCCYLVIGRDIAELYAFSMAIKQGDFKRAFTLPNELEGEAEIIKLKRTLNWMAHSLFMRDRHQQQSLVNTEKLRLHYQQLSVMDELTGLYNRRYFNEQLSHHVACAIHTKKPLTLMLIDVDNFKKVNDSLGHLKGDDLLRKLGAILRQSSRSGIDIPFRFGGDEFGIILPGMHAACCHTIGSRIQDSYSKIAPDITSLSIGAASLKRIYSKVSTPEEELIKAADTCVYKAKKSGRNSVIIEDQDSYYACPDLTDQSKNTARHGNTVFCRSLKR